MLFDVLVYTAVFTLENHSLYYSKVWFDKDGLFPVLLHRSGIVHQVFMQSQAIVIIVAIYWLFRSLKSYKGKIAKRRAMIIISGFLIEAVLFICQVSHMFFVTYFFDISVFGHVAVTISMFIAIFRYNLLGIIDMAREYIVDRLSEGVIAVDPDGRLQYYNEHERTPWSNRGNA